MCKASTLVSPYQSVHGGRLPHSGGWGGHNCCTGGGAGLSALLAMDALEAGRLVAGAGAAGAASAGAAA